MQHPVLGGWHESVLHSAMHHSRCALPVDLKQSRERERETERGQQCHWLMALGRAGEVLWAQLSKAKRNHRPSINLPKRKHERMELCPDVSQKLVMGCCKCHRKIQGSSYCGSAFKTHLDLNFEH